MSLVITKGYLIKREDYDTFDEIITIINEFGNKFTCFSSGSRKINSKNSRNLNYGDYIEFEFFYSENKLSKLKKSTAINRINNIVDGKWSLELLNDIFFKLDLEGVNFFLFYQKVLFYIIKNINDYLLYFYILIFFLKHFKIAIDFSKCFICLINKNINSIDIEECAIVCKTCFDIKKHKLISIPTLKLWFLLQNEINYNLFEISNYNIKELKKNIIIIINILYKKTGLYIDMLKWK